MLTDFQNSFASRLGKFATKSHLNIPPHLKYVDTLPCKIRKSEKWRQSEIYTVINDKSQDSTAKHLNCDRVIHHKFITQYGGKKFLKSVNIWRSYRQNG